MNPKTLSEFWFALEQIAQPLWFWIVQSAVFTTATALLIIAFKLIFKNRIRAKWHFLVWAILLIRIIFPVLPSTPLSVFNLAKMDEQSVTSSSVVNIISQEGYYRQSDEPRYSVTFGENAVPDNSADDGDGAYYFTDVHAFHFGEFFAVIWAIGAFALLTYFIIVLTVFRKRLKKQRTECDDKTLSVLNSCREKLGIKRNVRLYFADATPVLIGLFRPSIYIPESYSESELEAVITHELCHLKHLDVLWSGVAAVVLCLNWYNPVIWISFFMFKRDIELYCDERTLKYTDDKQDYAKLLLKTATKNKYVLGTSSLQSGKADVKRRIKFLAKYKKITALAVIAVILAAVISVVCLTNATSFHSDYLFHYDGFSYEYDSGSETIRIGGEGALTHDSAIHNKLAEASEPKHIIISPGITSIGDFFFAYDREGNTGKDRNHFDKIETVEIADTVTEIGDSAFAFCIGLEEISIPGSVTKIGEFAFENCDLLKSVSIPDSVESIGGMAFEGCSSLKELILSSKLTTVSEALCQNCKSLNRVVIPSGVTEISDGAFSNCIALESVSLGDSLTIIKDGAFHNCVKLSEITFPESLTTIDERVFVDCKNLKSVEIPKSVTKIGDNAFGYFDDKTNTNYKKLSFFSIKGYPGTAAEKYANDNGFEFAQTDGKTDTEKDIINPNISYSYDPASGTVHIDGEGAMNNYPSVSLIPWSEAEKPKTVIIGSGITSICSNAFAADYFDENGNPPNDYRYINRVELPDSLTKIGNRAFSCCGDLSEITLPNNLTLLGESAFMYCKSLKSIEIPDGVTEILGGTFAFCESLESVKLGKNTVTIGDSAFEETKLNKVTIPDTVKSIGMAAFYDCQFKSVTVPKSVTSIGEWALGYAEPFNPIEDFTIKGYKGTAAETYAKNNGFVFVAMD